VRFQLAQCELVANCLLEKVLSIVCIQGPPKARGFQEF